ncbi:MAG: c(7)-type cytochrome triheme domain-containing protein [Elusimicrobiota bacterium]
MNKTSLLVALGIAALLGMSAAKVKAADQKADAAKPAADAPKAPDTILFDKTAKMQPVTFPHAAHIKAMKGDCKECHEGAAPLFPQKKDKDQAGMKMADFYAGKQCGACHDGKKVVDGKTVFAAKTSCMKCHKKPAP